MSLNPISRFLRSLAFQLGLLYAALFTIGAAVLFGLLYVLVASALERKDHEVVEARLRQCEAIYEGGGLAELKARVLSASEEARRYSWFICLSGPGGSFYAINVPQEWITVGPSQLRSGGDPERVFWVEIPRDEERDFTIGTLLMEDGMLLHVGLSTSNSELFLKPFRQRFTHVMLGTLTLGLILGLIISWHTTRPLRQIGAAARTIIDRGRLSERVPIPSAQSELADLALEFNRMLERNQGLIQTIRESLDNVAHDLRTPLTRLRASAETGLESAVDPAAREALADCVEESDRVLTMVRTLMDIAEAESGMMRLELKEVSVAEILASVVDLYELVAEDKHIQLTTRFNGPCQARADESRLRQVFANLLDNAIKYSDPHTEVLLEADSQRSAVIVTIQDQGVGIDSSEQTRIWERLYRGDKSRTERGLGLGLSLVKAIVEAHHADVSVESELGKGSRFRVRIPRN
jgi:signal transduction histidine kinase